MSGPRGRALRDGLSPHIIGRRKNGEEFAADVAVPRLQVEGASILTASVQDMTEP